jgi:hypothetical protein
MIELVGYPDFVMNDSALDEFYSEVRDDLKKIDCICGQRLALGVRGVHTPEGIVFTVQYWTNNASPDIFCTP